MPDGTLAAPGLAFANELGTGLQRATTNRVRLVIAGVERIVVDPNEHAISLITGGTFKHFINGVEVMKQDAAGMTVTGTLNVSGLFTVGGDAIIPVGTMVATGRITPPNGWDFCNGGALLRTTYSGLFEALTKVVTGTRTANSGVISVTEDLTDLGLIGAQIEGTGFSTATIPTITAVAATSITISTSFLKPDLRGRVPAGRDTMGTVDANRLSLLTGGVDGANLGNAGGEDGHLLIEAEMPSHTHLIGTFAIGATSGAHGHDIPARQWPDDPIAADSETLKLSLGADNSNNFNFTSMLDTGGAHTHSFTGALAKTPLADAVEHNNVQPTLITNWIIFTGVLA
jgi:microcystin-dependent protein